MNALTQNYILQCLEMHNYYSQNKDSIDNVKSFSRLLPITVEMLEMCNTEFERSIAYINDYKREKQKKVEEIERISKLIKNAIRSYSVDFKKKIHIDEEAFLDANVLEHSDKELLDHFKRIRKMVEPLYGELLPYGVSHSLMKEFEHKIHDIIPAVPMDFSEIEQHKQRYHSALKAVDEIKRYLQFH